MSSRLTATLIVALVVGATASCITEEEPQFGEAVDVDHDALVGDTFPGIAMMNLMTWDCAQTDTPASNLPRLDTCPASIPPGEPGLYQPERRWTFEVVGTVTFIDNTYNVYTIRNEETGLCLTQSTFAFFGDPFYVYESACATGSVPNTQRFAYVPFNTTVGYFADVTSMNNRLHAVAGDDTLEMRTLPPSDWGYLWYLYL